MSHQASQSARLTFYEQFISNAALIFCIRLVLKGDATYRREN